MSSVDSVSHALDLNTNVVDIENSYSEVFASLAQDRDKETPHPLPFAMPCKFASLLKLVDLSRNFLVSFGNQLDGFFYHHY